MPVTQNIIAIQKITRILNHIRNRLRRDSDDLAKLSGSGIPQCGHFLSPDFTVLAIKGRIIVDHCMELRHVHIVLRTLMRVYFYVIPTFIIIVYLFPEVIARWTTLS